MRNIILILSIIGLAGAGTLLPGQSGDADKARQEAVEKARKARADGRFDDAVAALEEAIDVVAKDPEAVFLLADSALQAGQFDKAMTWSVKATEADKKNADAFRVAANAFFGRAEEAKAAPGASQGKIDSYYEDALSFTTSALALKPDDADTWALQGELCHLLSRPKESAESYARASALKPDDVSWIFFTARGRSLSGNHGTAVELMDQAIKLQPGEAWLHREKGAFLAASGTPTAPEQAVQAMAAALKAKNLDDQTRNQAPLAIDGLVGRANPNAAKPLIQGWCEAHPRDSYAWWWAGHYDAQLKDFDGAVKNFGKAFDVSGGTLASAAVSAGECQAMLAGIANPESVDGEKLEKAAAWMSKAAAVQGWNWPDPNATPIAKIQIWAGPLSEAGKMEAAAALLEKHALPLAKDDWRTLNSLGFFYRELGGPQGTKSSKAKELWTKSREFYVRASESVLKDASAQPASRAQVLNDTGLMYHYHFDDIAKGVEYYKKALTQDPEYIDALENLGLCLNILGKYEEAKSYFQRVLKIQPGRMVSRRGLAQAERADK